ncbi:MAG: MoaD/ThiS family protein [Actinomycetota bacterium]|nr:MoaD/ThiS family protein [Actinomycetota bacterium]
MPTLRLFARFREIAGTDTVVVEDGTVGEILDRAATEYGSAFENALTSAGVWVNGNPVDRTAPVGADDEMAIIPPVSGGSYAAPQTRPTLAVDPAESILSVIVLAALLVSAWIPLEWFVVISVAAALAWIWDLADTNFAGDGSINLYATLFAPTITAAATYAWGYEGLAGGLAASVAIVVFWPIFEERWRGVETIAMTASVAVVAATGAGALVMLRMMSTTVALTFVLIVSVAIIAALVTAVYGGQTIDPNIGTLVGALIAGLLAGVATSEIDLATGLFAAVAVAAGLIAGRVLGSMIRSGSIMHTVRLPGQLTPLDGLWLAAPLYWLALVLLG